MSSEQTQFGTLLKRYRTAAGLTQEALAARAQLSARTVADLERGISHTPRHDTLALLLEALSLTAQQRALLLAIARPEMAEPVPRARSLSPPPLPPTALIGREQEMIRAMTFLQRDGVRLLTLTGPSGVGKTRLGIQLAQDLGERFENGVVFVALAPLRDPSLLPATLAQGLGLRESPLGQVSEQVQAYLQEQQLLLVLDNFEQIRQAAPFIADLLATCPHLQVLITSRAPLHIRGEQELAIAPLALEAAVALFRARAQAVQPERDYAWPDVAAICEQVDRLPLAIELAAMHVKILALPLLLERLSSRFTLLREGAQDLPERQRTLQSAIAWSYDLLTAAQQRCFRALGVFLGGWTLDAAEAVCCQEGLLARDEVLMALAALIDHSLVSSESSMSGTPRFSMLETLREYALACLRAAGEEEQTRRQHALYYDECAEKVGWPTQGTHDVDLLQDFPNARAALHWATEQREIALGLKLAVHFTPLWFVHGQMREASAWLEQLLSLDAGAGEQAAPPALRLTALYGAARMAMSQGHEEQATALAQEMLHLAERSGDHAGQSLALANLGVFAQARGESAQAAASFAESYTQAQPLPGPCSHQPCRERAAAGRSEAGQGIAGRGAQRVPRDGIHLGGGRHADAAGTPGACAAGLSTGQSMLSRKSWSLSPASQSHLYRLVPGGDGRPRLRRTPLRTCHPTLRCRRSAPAQGTDPTATSGAGTFRSDRHGSACCPCRSDIHRGVGSRGSLDAGGSNYLCLVQHFLVTCCQNDPLSLRNSLLHLWSATPGAKIPCCAIKCESTCTCVSLYWLQASQISWA